MNLRLLLFVLMVPCLGAGASAQTVAAPVQAEANKSAVSFYGFARFDVIFDGSRPNSFQSPTFIRSEAAGAENRGNLVMHPRLTRFGVNYRAPNDGTGPAVLANLEIDFQNGGSNSRAIPRYRHAFLQMRWGPHALLAGQTWDVVSPLFPTVNADTLMWNVGNMGDRRPQLRYAYEPKTGLNLRAAIGLTGAVDNLDADGNGVNDGEASQTPNFQWRLGYTAAGGKLFVGASAHYARLHTDTAIAGENDFTSHSIGADADLRLTPSVAVRAEAWMGSNLGDFRGGIGQSFNVTTGRAVESRGGWVELGLRRGRYGLSTGLTIDDPQDGEVADGAPTQNRAWYVTNQLRVASPVTAGVDYIYWRTEFKGVNEGTDNRVNAYLAYTF